MNYSDFRDPYEIDWTGLDVRKAITSAADAIGLGVRTCYDILHDLPIGRAGTNDEVHQLRLNFLAALALGLALAEAGRLPPAGDASDETDEDVLEHVEIREPGDDTGPLLELSWRVAGRTPGGGLALALDSYPLDGNDDKKQQAILFLTPAAAHDPDATQAVIPARNQIKVVRLWAALAPLIEWCRESHMAHVAIALAAVKHAATTNSSITCLGRICSAFDDFTSRPYGVQRKPQPGPSELPAAD